jgi:hypothetical protein
MSDLLVRNTSDREFTTMRLEHLLWAMAAHPMLWNQEASLKPMPILRLAREHLSTRLLSS